MYISALNNSQNTYYTRVSRGNSPQNGPSFTAGKLPPMEFRLADFFVHIKGYGKNYEWAKGIKATADLAVEDIKDPSHKNVNIVLRNIARGVREANKCTDNMIKQKHSGLLRTKRIGYEYGEDWAGEEIYTPINDRYAGYTQRLTDLTKNPLKNPYPDICLSRPHEYDTNKGKYLEIVHGDTDYVNDALDRVGGMFFNLKKDYILQPEKVTNEALEDITSRIAEMRWILAHATPWERGSDSIGNVFTRALYKSMGIKTYPLKKGVSLDLEAFCTPLDEYKKNFASFFEKPPAIIE